MLESLYDFESPRMICNHYIYHEPMHVKEHFQKDAHNEWELLLFLRGNATYVIEGRHYKLRPFDLVIIRPSKYHYIQIDGNSDYERYNVYFHTSVVGKELLHALSNDLEVINCAESERICNLFSKTDLYVHFGDDAFVDLLRGLLRELFYNLLHAGDRVASPTSLVSPLIKKALTYINEHLDTIEDVEEISAALFVTETHFFRIFKTQMNISPMKYITQKRLLAAEKRIRAGERPTDVYLKCGFHTYPAFYKRYVDFFGRTPSQRTKK